MRGGGPRGGGGGGARAAGLTACQRTMPCPARRTLTTTLIILSAAAVGASHNCTPGPGGICAGGVCDQCCATWIVRRQVCGDCVEAECGKFVGNGSSNDGGVVTSCPVLLQLPGGCTRDISLDDPAMESPTLVSQLCPAECSGHGDCSPAAVDITFMGGTDDVGSEGVQHVEQQGSVCVGQGGVSFRGWADQARFAVSEGYVSNGE